MASIRSTIISSATTASIFYERSITISQKELELALAKIQKEQEKPGSAEGENKEDPAPDAQESYNREYFEVYWDGHDDLENPQNWALWKRACILVGVSFQTLVV